MGKMIHESDGVSESVTHVPVRLRHTSGEGVAVGQCRRATMPQGHMGGPGGGGGYGRPVPCCAAASLRHITISEIVLIPLLLEPSVVGHSKTSDKTRHFKIPQATVGYFDNTVVTGDVG